jgi:hypothetical protein
VILDPKKIDPKQLDEAAKVGASGCLLTAYAGFLGCFPLALIAGLAGVVYLFLQVTGKVGG